MYNVAGYVRPREYAALAQGKGITAIVMYNVRGDKTHIGTLTALAFAREGGFLQVSCAAAYARLAE